MWLAMLPPPATRMCTLLRAGFARVTDICDSRGAVYVPVQINAGTEALDGEEFGDDNFDFDEVDDI